ncbi:DUF11 domain-containing protein [Neomegalonema perideroedes]|uniref:DUF11 domain-containing protein n=1 Tax=Neomegalonema perideroedes TaxID=217219 RepID=UPI00035F4D3D|nr:DUF11 domain-containing protein [Neomegalonema perideroedes]
MGIQSLAAPALATPSLARPPARRIRRAALAASILLGTALAEAPAASALTPIGTVITGQVFADYQYPGSAERFRAASNLASLRVLGVQAGLLEPDISRVLSPGATTVLVHSLTNVGNAASSYALSLSFESEWRLEGVVLALDVNRDGRLDSGDRVIDGPLFLHAQGEISAQILIVGRAPAAAPAGTLLRLRLDAEVVDPHPDAVVRSIAPARDEITLTRPGSAHLTKSLGESCSATVPAGGEFSVSLGAFELGRLSAYVRAFPVDGGSARGVMVEDQLPAEAFPSLSAPQISLLGSYALLGFGEGSATVWRSWSSWSGGERPTRIGFFLPESVLTSGAEARMTYRLQALSGGALSAFASAPAFLDAEGDGRLDGEFDLSAAAPCASVPPASCFVEANGAFALAGFQNSAVEAALAQARGALYYFTPEGAPLAGDSEAALILRAPAAAAVGELTAVISDSVTGDSIRARLTPVPGRSGYYAMEQAARIQLAEAAGRGLICQAGSAASCVLRSALRSRLTADVSAVGCSDSLRVEALVDSGGVTFVGSDSANARLPETEVSITRVETAGAPSALSASLSGFSAISDAEGLFRLPQGLPTGDYCVTAAKQDYLFPSLALVASTPFSRRVDPAFALGCGRDAVFQVAPARLSAAGADLNGLDIPLDLRAAPVDDQGLWVEKSVSASTAQVGDFLRYEVQVENRTGRRLSGVTLRDEAARGLAYAPGSLRVDGAAPADGTWSFQTPNVNLFRLAEMEAGASLSVSYVMRVGAGASGDLLNSAWATGLRPDSTRVDSAASQARVKLENKGPISDENYLIGRVAVVSACERLPAQIDALGLEDAGTGTLRLPRADGTLARPRVWPLAGARVWLETGVYAVTDERGYFSMYGVQSGPHVARLDGETTPRGLKPTSLRSAPSSSGRGDWSQFVNLRFGDLARADFHLVADCAQMEAIAPSLATDSAQPRIERQLDEAVRFDARVRDLESDLRARARGDGDVGRGLSGDLRADAPLLERREAQVAEGAQEQSRLRAAMPKSEEVVQSLTAEMGREGRWLWPLDGVSRDGRFMAAIRADAEPVLYVNGVAVPQSQLGERLRNPAARAELVAWYGVALNSGANQLEIRGRDQFGNERTLASATMTRPGAPERLVLTSDRLSLPADGGRSVARLTIKLADSAGIPVEGVSFVTLHSEDGAWLTQDLDGKARGLQVRLEDGEAHVRLASSVRSGPVLVTAESEDKRKAELNLRFSADERPLMGVGLLAFEANFAGRGWRIPESLRAIDDEDDYGESYEIGARGAVFLKGKIRGDALLTLLYDSSRTEDDRLFRDLDPNAYYPVYGDGSVTGYEAQARSPLYVRLEKGGFMGMWGDFATDAENDLKLGGLRRNLTGVNATYEGEGWRAQVFAARPDASTRTVEIQGLGLAMGYQLPGAPVRAGSERLAIIVRDRLNPGILLSRRDVRRGSDFALDYDSGRLDFFSPIPSLDDDLNPVYIEAYYETEAGGESYTVAGARLERELAEGLRVGGAYSHVDDPAERNRLAAVYGEYRPNQDVRVRAEGAWSRNPDTGATGTAVLLEGEAQLGGGWRVDGGFGRAEADFQGESASVSSGRMEARAGVQGPLGDLAELRTQGVYSADLTEDNWRASAEAELRRNFGPVEGRLGVRHEQAETGGERTEQTFVTTGLRASTDVLGRSVSGTLEAAKAVDSPAFRASARLDVQATPDTTFYVKHEFANDDATVTGPEGDGYLSVADAFSQGRTVIGIENDWRPDTRVYSETRLTGDASARGVENAVGLRGEYALAEKLTLQAQAEHVRAFSGDGADSAALSFALRDERSQVMSRAFRVEGRVQDKDWTFGSTAAIIGRATEELTLFSAARYDGRLPDVGFASHKAHLRLGLAFRPTNNRTHILAYYEAEYERAASDLREDSLNHILAAHINSQVTDRLQISGRLGLRFTDQRFDGARHRSEVGLADIRVLYGLTDRFALEGRAGALTAGWGESTSWSGGLGFNYAATENVEFGVGYNFSGFDEDRLDPQGYNREGVYMRVNIKFDEELFNWLAAP